MKRIILALTILVLPLIFMSCGSKEHPAITAEMPQWFNSPPSDDANFYYAVAARSSARRDIARRKSVLDATAEIARKLGQRVDDMSKQFISTATSGDKERIEDLFESATQTLTRQNLAGVIVDQTYYASTANGTQVECFVLVKVPKENGLKAMNEALKNSLSQDEELYIRFKASKAFEEMKKELDNYGVNY